jgi:hypothetical protein
MLGLTPLCRKSRSPLTLRLGCFNINTKNEEVPLFVGQVHRDFRLTLCLSCYAFVPTSEHTPIIIGVCSIVALYLK